MERVLLRFEGLIRRVGLICALVLLPLLMAARVTEVVIRNMNIPGSLFNAMESELFMLFAFLTIATAAVSGAHVRVDILRDRWGPRTRAWVEIVGTAVFVLPFAGVVLWYGTILTGIVAEDGERSAIALGAPVRWLVIGAMPFGIAMFAAAWLSRTLRCVLFLAGRAADPNRAPDRAGA